jgi:monoterpene epsilon-lactone hydrolase
MTIADYPLRIHFQSMTDRMAANPGMDLVTLRSMLEEVAARSSEPESVTYAEEDADGVRGIWCHPLDAATDAVIVYLHGGGFVSNSAASHRKLAAHFAKLAGASAFVVDFRLAPEHVYPAQLDDAEAAYAALVERGFQPQRIAIAGDSAGGNLAVNLVSRLKQRARPLPAAVVAFSPWVDMELLGESLAANAESDALVSRPVVETMSALLLGDQTSRTDPMVNPLHADLNGFPPLYVTASESEALFDDARRLVERARGHDVETEFVTTSGHQHVFQYMAGRSPDADESLAGAATWLRRRLGI